MVTRVGTVVVSKDDHDDGDGGRGDDRSDGGERHAEDEGADAGEGDAGDAGDADAAGGGISGIAWQEGGSASTRGQTWDMRSQQMWLRVVSFRRHVVSCLCFCLSLCCTILC